MAQNITEPFVSSRELVPLANPLSQEESFMRPLLLPALLKAVQLNLHHQRLSARFFEIGNVFRKTETNFQEESHMGLVLFGSSRPESWQSKPAPLDIYELKGIFDLLNSHWDFPFKLAEREIKNYLHPHQSFQILYRNQEIGMMGMLHPSLMRLFDLPAPPAVMELNLGDWLEARKIRPMTPIKKYPFVERDIAVVIDRTQNWNDIKTTAERSVPNLLVDILPFDIFMGESLGSSKKSVAFRIKLQNNDHTLTDNEINSAVDKIKTALQSTCGAQVR